MLYILFLSGGMTIHVQEAIQGRVEEASRPHDQLHLHAQGDLPARDNLHYKYDSHSYDRME